jgi:hypothetical protein
VNNTLDIEENDEQFFVCDFQKRTFFGREDATRKHLTPNAGHCTEQIKVKNASLLVQLRVHFLSDFKKISFCPITAYSSHFR